VLAICGHARRNERDSERGREGDESRDRIGRDARVQERFRIRVDECRRLAEGSSEIERHVVSEGVSNQLAIRARAAAYAAARRAEGAARCVRELEIPRIERKEGAALLVIPITRS
jgi:hypothetical protein